MASKNLVGIWLNGGMDHLAFMPARDTASAGFLNFYRQAAPGMQLNYTPAIKRTGNISAGGDLITGLDTTNLTVGMKVYGDGLKRVDLHTITAVGGTQVTISPNSKVSLTGANLEFASSATINTVVQQQLFDCNEEIDTGRDPAFNSKLPWFADTFNTKDTVGNAGITKMAIIANVAPMRRKLYKNGNSTNYLVSDGAGGFRPAVGAELIAQVTSHNDQQVTVMANAPEGAVKGWGGGIADLFVDGITGELNKLLASVTADGVNAFSVGDTASAFTISSAGLVRRLIDYDGGFVGEKNVTVAPTLKSLGLLAMQTSPDAQNDFAQPVIQQAKIAIDFQDVLINAMEITDPPAVTPFNHPYGDGTNDPRAFAGNLKQIARMLLANNPRRGVTINRTGTTVTISTEVTNATATRIAGSTTITISAPNHRLFTSNNSVNNLTDSIVFTNTDAQDNGEYKVILDPADPDNQFSVISSNTFAIAGQACTFRLKHNLTTANEVFIDAVGFDSVSPENGYPVTSVIDSTSFTVTTTDSTTLTNLAGKVKTINVSNQVFYTGTSKFGWDTHTGTNDNALAGLDWALKYFDSLVSKIEDAQVVTFGVSEFGRTLGSNSGGSDHGYGGNYFVLGKPVKGNKIFGTLPSYDPAGADISAGFFIPTTSTNQFSATLAKWMGANDAQVLELFPDLVHWPANERYLGFL